ncbi:MAG: hypothetical protein QG635_1993 [Bacteroidota bacterium]|nr:hypothetical protein [Bacteroidota bacterium]
MAKKARRLPLQQEIIQKPKSTASVKPARDNGNNDNSVKEQVIARKAKSNIKFEWSFKNQKFRIGLPFGIILFLFLWTWTKPEVTVIDPWYSAAQLVDSSKKITDPVLSKKLLDEGGSRLKALTSKYPSHAKLHFFLGYYYLTAKKWDNAITEYIQAIHIDSGATINPVWMDAKRHLAIAVVNKNNEFMVNKDTKASMEFMNRMKPYLNDMPDYLTDMGIIYHNQGNLDSAVEFYSRSLNKDPRQDKVKQNLILAWMRMGIEARQKGEPDRAMSFFDKVINQNQQHEEALYNMAILWNEKNDDGNAIDFFKRVLRVNPKNANAKELLIQIYRRQNDTLAIRDLIEGRTFMR